MRKGDKIYLSSIIIVILYLTIYITIKFFRIESLIIPGKIIGLVLLFLFSIFLIISFSINKIKRSKINKNLYKLINIKDYEGAKKLLISAIDNNIFEREATSYKIYLLCVDFILDELNEAKEIIDKTKWGNNIWSITYFKIILLIEEEKIAEAKKNYFYFSQNKSNIFKEQIMQLSQLFNMINNKEIDNNFIICSNYPIVNRIVDKYKNNSILSGE